MSARVLSVTPRVRAVGGAGLVPAALFAGFLALYAIYPNNYPHHDELYHVLAGASYAADGTLSLGDGLYTRTPLFTMLIGTLFETFGVALPVARAPSIIASALWVLAIWAFVRPAAGRLAATLAAVGFGLCPLVADVAKMTRFYALHGLFFTLGAFALYWATAVAAGTLRRACGCLMSAVCLAAALYLQLTTVIGAFALALWAAGYLAVARLGLGHRFFTLLALGTVAAAALLLVAHEAGLLTKALDTYRRTAAWATELRDYEGYYLDLLLTYYPVLLPLFPLAALHAFVRAPTTTAFCATLFGVGAVLHSLGGMKAERYLTYLMPFFWIVLGIAAASLVASVPAAIGTLAVRISALPVVARLPRKWVGGAVGVAAAGSVWWFLVINLALPETVQKLVHRLDAPIPDWAALPAAVGLDRHTILLTPNDLHALWFIGDLHADVGPRAHAHIPSQTGRPFLTDAETLAALVGCSRSGVLASDAWRWQNPGIVAPEVRTYAERQLAPHPAGPALNLVLYTWRNPSPRAAPCPAPFDRPLRLQPLAP